MEVLSPYIAHTPEADISLHVNYTGIKKIITKKFPQNVRLKYNFLSYGISSPRQKN